MTKQPSITCPSCGRTSYHPQDIASAYCGYCRLFHNKRKPDIMSNDNVNDFTHLADFILLGCLYEAFAKEGFDKTDAVCHRRFIGRFRYWQNITLDGHLPAKWVDDVVVTLTRANTTAR